MRLRFLFIVLLIFALLFVGCTREGFHSCAVCGAKAAYYICGTAASLEGMGILPENCEKIPEDEYRAYLCYLCGDYPIINTPFTEP